jgi:hypothetical protein
VRLVLPLACFVPVHAPLAVQEVTFAADQLSTAVSPSVVLLGVAVIVTLGAVLPPLLLLLLLLLVPPLLLLLVLMVLPVSLLPPQAGTTTVNRATIAEKTRLLRKNAPSVLANLGMIGAEAA